MDKKAGAQAFPIALQSKFHFNLIVTGWFPKIQKNVVTDAAPGGLTLIALKMAISRSGSINPKCFARRHVEVGRPQLKILASFVATYVYATLSLVNKGLTRRVSANRAARIFAIIEGQLS